MGNQTRRIRRQQRLAGLPLESLLSLLEQTRSVTYAMNFEPEAAEISLTIKPLPDTVLMAVLDRKPMDMPDLSKFLGAPHTLTAQMAVSEIHDVIDLFDSLKKPADTPQRRKPTEKIETLLGLVEPAKPREYAMAFDLSATDRFSGTMLAHADEPEELVRIAHGSTEIMKFATVGDLLGSNPLDVELTTAATQIEGAPVDHADLRFREPSSLKPIESKFFNAMWGKGETTLEMAGLGDLAVFAVGTPMEDFVSADASRSSMQARRWFAPGAFCYLDFDLAGYTQMTMAFAGRKTPGVAAPPFSTAAYHQNGVGSYRMKFPIELAAAMRKIGQAGGSGRRGRRGPGAVRGTTQKLTEDAAKATGISATQSGF